jgi:hypothetical protein
MSATELEVGGRPIVATGSWTRVAAWSVPLGLLLLGAAVRWWAAGQVVFPANEGSAFYVDTARNIVEGRGFVSDAIWSYATPPLVLPKPAFELWMPMASFLAALPMALLGTSFAVAQLGSILLGAAIGPLTWYVARQAAHRQGLGERRAATVAIGSGIVASILGPFLIAAALPDSTTPFLVLGVLGAIATARLVERPSVRVGLALGVLLGLAYLSRQEAVYLGLTYLILAIGPLRRAAAGRRLREAISLLAAPVAGGLVVVAPWFARNVAAFGTLFPGQALENVYLSRNEEIFAYLERPTAESFLAQGPVAIVAHMVDALSHDLLTVVVLPALPVGLLGLIAALVMRRSPAFREATALRALLVAGLVIYLVTSLLLPVATLWGTFLHASGPPLVGLIVAAMLGLDAAIARLGRYRRWSRPNAWLGTVLVVAVAAPFSLLQIDVLGRQAATQQARIAAIAAQLEALPEIAAFPRAGTEAAGPPRRRAALISDHAVWLAHELRRPVIALPDEPPAAVAQLAEDFGTTLVVLLDERGRYPAAWLDARDDACLASAPERLEAPGGGAWLVRLQPGCGPP